MVMQSLDANINPMIDLISNPQIQNEIRQL